MWEITKNLSLRQDGLGLYFDLLVPGLGFQELRVSWTRIFEQFQELQSRSLPDSVDAI